MTSDHGSESRTCHGLLILQLGNLWAPDVFLWVLTQTKSEFWHVLTCFQMFSQVTSVFIVSPMSKWFQFPMIPLFFATKSTAMHRFLQRSRRPYQVFMARNPGTSAGGPRPRPEVKVELGSKKEVTKLAGNWQIFQYIVCSLYGMFTYMTGWYWILGSLLG